jgi:hypothetical protein
MILYVSPHKLLKTLAELLLFWQTDRYAFQQNYENVEKQKPNPFEKTAPRRFNGKPIRKLKK